MSGTIGHEADERFQVGRPQPGLRRDRLAGGADDLQVGAALAGADVVDAPGLRPIQDGDEGVAVVFHIQPVADLGAVTVDRKGLARQRVTEHEGNELLRKLKGAVVVGAAGDDDRDGVGAMVGQAKEVGRGFAGRIGAAGSQRCVFCTWRGALHIPVHLVGGDLYEPLHPVAARGVEERLRPHNVGMQERRRVEDAAVHMGLRRKVHHRPRPTRPDDAVQQTGVRNVAMDECVVGMAFDVAQIRQVASVGEVIEVHDPPAGAVPQQQPDKVAADESAAAGDQHDGCHLRLKIIVRIPQVRQVGIPR